MDDQGTPSDPQGPNPPSSEGRPSWSLPPYPSPGAPALPDFPASGQAPPPPRKRGRRILTIVAVAAIVLMGGAAAAAYFLLKGSTEQVMQAVPANSVFVATVNLDPGAGQKVNLFRLSSKFPALGDRQQLASIAQRELDSALADTGLTSTDVLPWLGSEIGVAVQWDNGGDPRTEVLVATKDSSASSKALSRMNGSWTSSDYDGTTVFTRSDGPGGSYAIVDGIVVLGSDRSAVLGVLDAATGKTQNFLSTTAYSSANATLPKDRLASFFVDPSSLQQALESNPIFAGSPQTPFASWKSLGGAVTATPDGLALDINVVQDPSKMTPAERALASSSSHTNSMLSSVPGDSYGVIAIENLDAALKAIPSSQPGAIPFPSIADSPFVSNLSGDAAIEVRPEDKGPIPGGAVLIGAKDGTQMQATLDQLAPIVARVIGSGSLFGTPASPFSEYRPVGAAVNRSTTTRYEGVAIRALSIKGTPFSITYAVSKGVAIVGSSPGQVEKVIDTQGDAPRSLGASPTFTSAIADVPGQSELLYVDVPNVVSGIRAGLPPAEQMFIDQMVEPNLKPITVIEYGVATSPSGPRSRLFIKIR